MLDQIGAGATLITVAWLHIDRCAHSAHARLQHGLLCASLLVPPWRHRRPAVSLSVGPVWASAGILCFTSPGLTPCCSARRWYTRSFNLTWYVGDGCAAQWSSLAPGGPLYKRRQIDGSFIDWLGVRVCGLTRSGYVALSGWSMPQRLPTVTAENNASSELGATPVEAGEQERSAP